jgi:putative ABC transport system permease protein
MIGIFIGIAAVVSLIGLGEGLRNAITGQFGFLGTDVLTVQANGMGMAGPPGSGVATPLTSDLVDEIRKVNGVDVAFNRYIRTGSLEYKDTFGIGFAGSVPDKDERKVFEKMSNLKTQCGRLLKDGDEKKAVLGSMFREDTPFGIECGDQILLTGKKYEVIGILEKKGSFLFDNIVLLNEESIIKDFGKEDEVNIIAVKVKNEDQIQKVKKDVEKVLRKKRDVKEGEEDFSVESAQASLDALDSTLFAVQLFITIIASISLIVGGIGIMNTMYTSVLERTKEIGILKSVGAKNSSVFTLFFLESGLLGMVGGIIGIIIGLILAYGLSAIGRLALGSDLIQAQVSLSLILGSLSFSFLVGTLAGLLPAIQAAKKHPVDALRFAK